MSRIPRILVPRDSSPSSGDRRTLPEIMFAYERIIIIQALQLNGFCRSTTAASLGISRNHLYSRVRLLGIDLGAMPRRGRVPKSLFKAEKKEE